MDTENNTAVPHDEFIVGFERGTIGFHFIGEPSELLAVPQKKKFAVFVILHTLAPFILIPLWAYHERNWWLLSGIAASLFGIFFATRAAVQGPKSASGGFLPFVFIGLWITTGIRSSETFYSLCALWSWALFLIAEDFQRRCATQNLITSSTVFDEAIANQKIVVIRNEPKA